MLQGRFQQFERAKQWLDVGMGIDSSSAYLQNQYGIWYAMQGNLPQALALFRKAIAADSTNSWFRSNLDHACQMMGLYDEAESSFLKAVELAPTEVVTMGNLGNLYFQ
jgi:Flp pilus assembly protein TadD